MSETTTPEQFWERRYAESERVWSGNVNQTFADIVGELPPGTALDLGCGEGGDAVWLARHGWDATGVDLSATAVRRAAEGASRFGVSRSALRFEAGDLVTWQPPHSYDLVASSFLHSWPVTIPREKILRRAARFVAPGGHLLVVSHAAPPVWADPEVLHGYVFSTPAGDLEALALDRTRWRVLLCETRDRAVTAPDGNPASLSDGVVLAQHSR